MKDDIQRGIRSLNKRATGSSPDIGRVARMRGTGLPQGGRKRRRRGPKAMDVKAMKARQRVVLYRSILLGVFTLALLIGVFAYWLIPQLDRKSEKIPVSRVMDEPKVRVASKFVAPEEQVTVDLVKRALAVRDPRKVPVFFRTGDAEPQEVVSYLEKMGTVDGTAERFEWLSNMDANGMSLEGVLVTFRNPDKARNRLALLTPDAEGVWKVDFPAFARSVKPSWEELLGNHAGAARVRVYVGRDGEYNGIFKDDRQWICHGIASPDTEELLLGYCKVGTPQADALERMLGREVRLSRAILEIRHVEGAERRQYEITRVLAQDWVMGDRAFDEPAE